ncbi:hypothetical protein HMPREF1545_03600, partial [Oscillibacter sp. KLE 1728]
TRRPSPADQKKTPADPPAGENELKQKPDENREGTRCQEERAPPICRRGNRSRARCSL